MLVTWGHIGYSPAELLTLMWPSCALWSLGASTAPTTPEVLGGSKAEPDLAVAACRQRPALKELTPHQHLSKP